jgi:formylglycine-generating enzyme required for sulfatase activity
MRPLNTRLSSLLLLLGLALAPWCQAAATAGRYALLMGNGSYPKVETGVNKFGALRNPPRDVADMRRLLTDQGFQIKEELLDAPNKEQMEKKVGNFVDGLPKGSVALVYYSGHGVEEDGTNYLLPIRGFRNKVEVKDFALKANWVMHELAASPAAGSLLILDSCRDHVPLDETKGAQNEGFATMHMTGVLVAYATQAGKTAWGQPDQPNSLYTQHLIAAWRAKSREPLEMIFKETATRVAAATSNHPEPQIPWYDPGLLGEPFCPDPLGCVSNQEEHHPPGLPNIGSLSVRIQPPGAKLRINEQEVGTVGIEGLVWESLRPGAYTVVATLEGYQELQQKIEIKGGLEMKVVLALSPLPSTKVAASPDPRQLYEPEMVSIEGGCFLMGSPESEPGRDANEGPQHTVCLPPFLLGKYEITFEQWDACVAGGGCTHAPSDEEWGRGKRPVINVSWQDAIEFLEWLNRTTAGSYRLPSEAEWEYAARGGTTTPFYTGDCITTAQANYDGDWREYNSCGAQTGVDLKKTLPVGIFPANPRKLHDMAGNVWEWVADCWHDNYKGSPVNNLAWQDSCVGDSRIFRGGSWYSDPAWLRSSQRNRGKADIRISGLGFRVAKSL